MNVNGNMTDISCIRKEKAYFAAVNGKDGFVSFFDKIFFCEPIKRRYIIKGGPGTGKSSFMRRVALHAQKAGRDVEYYYCSSDTSSLDGVIIDGSIALLDGTAPHSCDTVLPGVRDGLIDLGRYWDASALEKHEDAVRSLGASKSAAYANAYGYLGAAGRVEQTLKGVILPCVKTDKMRAAVRRICDKIQSDGKGEVRVCQTDAFGIRGAVHLDTLKDMATVCHTVEDHYGSADLLMRELLRRAGELGISAWVSYDTVDPSSPREIYFPCSGDYFCVRDEADGEEDRINMKRFVDTAGIASVRGAYRTARQAYRTLLELAAHELSLAGKAHADMEKIYVSCMDFDAEQKYCTEFLKSIS